MLPQQTSKICMYTSFFKRQRQYDTLSERNYQSRDTATRQRARYACILRSLSVGDDWTHLKRNKLSI